MAITINLLFVLIAVFSFWAGYNTAKEKLYKKVKHKEAELTFRLQSIYKDEERVELAKSLYGKNWKKRLKECDEAHLGGECPLCNF